MSFATTVVGIITAIGTVLTALALVINAMTERRRSRRIERKVDHLDEQGAETHIIVNQQRTDMQRYIRAQSALLTQHGIELPIDQSIDPSEAA
jgi:hypothetical protein